jgi:3',5'-cyclic AMP phosphodiesterase CpdA
MSHTFVLAHLSDIHQAPLPWFGPRHWNAKRLTGFLNWHTKRRTVHKAETLDLLVHDLKQHHSDHIAVTGDLINIGLPIEYVTAERWLQALGPPDRVTVVPGNHDLYTPLRNDPGIARWQAWMSPLHDVTGLSQSAPERGGPAFPFVRRFGRMALIGLNSALPQPPFVAAGRVGEEQMSRLGTILAELGREHAVRVVLIHHPPLPGMTKPSRALADAAALQDVLVRHGAELVLHGHTHLDTVVSCPRPSGPAIPIVCVPSASLALQHGLEPLARYHLFHVEIGNEEVRIEIVARGLTRPGGPITEISRSALTAESLGTL